MFGVVILKVLRITRKAMKRKQSRPARRRDTKVLIKESNQDTRGVEIQKFQETPEKLSRESNQDNTRRRDASSSKKQYKGYK